MKKLLTLLFAAIIGVTMLAPAAQAKTHRKKHHRKHHHQKTTQQSAPPAAPEH